MDIKKIFRKKIFREKGQGESENKKTWGTVNTEALVPVGYIALVCRLL